MSDDPSQASPTPDSPEIPSPAPWQELALTELQQQRTALLEEIRQLEARRGLIQKEIEASFAGQADGVARRLKGFQDYLVGALQDLAVAAEQVELVPQQVLVQPSPLDQISTTAEASQPLAAVAAAGLFGPDEVLIRERLAGFGGQPDFYADPWQLRRTLDASGAALLDDWFLGQGGRGAQPSCGSRSRNALVAAAAIAILGELYGERFQTLVLASQPERLGERRDALVERADRLEERGELPFIVVDAGEPVIEIPILQFPLWLVFAAGPGELMADETY